MLHWLVIFRYLSLVHWLVGLSILVSCLLYLSCNHSALPFLQEDWGIAIGKELKSSRRIPSLVSFPTALQRANMLQNSVIQSRVSQMLMIYYRIPIKKILYAYLFYAHEFCSFKGLCCYILKVTYTLSSKVLRMSKFVALISKVQNWENFWY